MAKLAINGGPKVIKKPLESPWPVFDKKEEKLLLEVLRSGQWWRGGYKQASESKVGQFENAFAKYQDARYAIAVTNGTTALECALGALGVEAGDEVIVPALSFIASASAIALVNGIPVFVDVDPETYNIDPDAMEAAITKNTRGVVVVHNGGYPVDMDRVLAIARKHKIFVLEDSAHAHGSEWRGKRIGALGDMGTFSFQAFKTLTAGEGGLVLTNDKKLADSAFSLQTIGRMPDRPWTEFHCLASNLRMTEFQGAVLLGQLSRLDKQTETREKNTAYLAEGLKDIPGLRAIKRDKRVTRWGFYYWNMHYNAKEFDGVSRDAFLAAVNAEGLGMHVGAHGAPMYHHKVFQEMNFGRTGCPISCPFAGRKRDYRKVSCPEAERLYKEEAIALGHRLFLGGKKDMDRILDVLRKVRENTAELKKTSRKK